MTRTNQTPATFQRIKFGVDLLMILGVTVLISIKFGGKLEAWFPRLSPIKPGPMKFTMA